MITTKAGFANAVLIGTIVLSAAFAGYSFWIYHEGGAAANARLEQFQAEVAALKKVHDAEDAAQVAKTQSLIKEKDNERERLLASSGRAWAAELARVRAIPPIRGIGTEPESAGAVATICNGTDGNQRLSDAMEKSKRDFRDAIADYQAGTGKLLAVAERQAASWDNLKSVIAGIRQVNLPPGTP